MKKLLVVATLMLAAVLPARAESAPSVRCVATDTRTACSYVATGYGAYHADRMGGWFIRVLRNDVTVWQAAGQTPGFGTVPSLPGDEVLIQLFSLAGCYLPNGTAVPCVHAGAVVVAEGTRVINTPF